MALCQHLHLLRPPLSVDAAGHVHRGVGLLPHSLSKLHGGGTVILPESAHFLGVRSFVSPLLELLVAVQEVEQHRLALVLD